MFGTSTFGAGTFGASGAQASTVTGDLAASYTIAGLVAADLAATYGITKLALHFDALPAPSSRVVTVGTNSRTVFA